MPRPRPPPRPPSPLSSGVSAWARPRPTNRRWSIRGSHDATRLSDRAGFGRLRRRAGCRRVRRRGREHARPYRAGLCRGPRRGGAQRAALRCPILDAPWPWRGDPACLGRGHARSRRRRRTAAGAPRPRSRAARTRPRGTGNWRACRCPGTGRIFPRPRPAFPDATRRRGLPSGRDAGAFSATATPRACRSSTAHGAEHLRTGLADLLYLGRQRVPDRRA